MPSFCLIVGCSNDKKRRPDLSFCRVPKVITSQGEQTEILSNERRTRWLAAISRDDLTESKLENDRVCGIHFHSGQAASLWDKFNLDWVPSLHLGHSKLKSSDQQEKQQERAQRVRERRKREREREEQVQAVKEKKAREDESEAHGDRIRDISFAVQDEEDLAEVPEEEEEGNNMATQTEPSELTQSRSTQTEQCDYMFRTPKPWMPEKSTIFEQEFFEGDDGKVRFYTGLPSWEVLMKTFSFVSPHVNRRSLSLSKFQEFVLVLIKLRLAVPHQDLAYRFDVSRTVVSRIIVTWLTVMDVRLSPLISWPSREQLQRTMPKCFIDSFGLKTSVIIDCFEIFIDRPSNLLARAQTFSNYKHHNTAKVLIGITPQGTISFVSEAWGGRTSDKFLTENCGFLKNLLPGDLVLADRGFTVHEQVWFHQAELNVPAFTRGKQQLDPVDVEKTRKIANVRIHVERVIGILRQKYTILQSTLSTDYLACEDKSKAPLIDKIIRVCAALVNLCPPIVNFD